MRAWLNDVFFVTAFDVREQEAIIKPEELDIASDRVFLLSYEDACKCYKVTDVDTTGRAEIVSYQLTEEVLKKSGRYYTWWLRTASKRYHHFCAVDADGALVDKVLTSPLAVRPAMWANMALVSAANEERMESFLASLRNLLDNYR